MHYGLGVASRVCLASVICVLFAVSAFSQEQHSVYLEDLDRKAQPCDDFYQFANGTWRANNPIPASMTRWSRRWQAGETAKDKLHDILEAAAAEKNAPKGSTEQIIGDYYGACMDEAKVNARGIEPLKPWFAKIDAARDTAAIQQVIRISRRRCKRISERADWGCRTAITTSKTSHDSKMRGRSMSRTSRRC